MKIGRVLTTIVAAAIALSLAAPAAADSVYMKNGRIITSAVVRVEGDKVVIRQLGGWVTIPMSLVDRIVEDDAEEQPRLAQPSADPAGDPLDLNDPANQNVDPSQLDPSAGNPAAGDPAGGDPTQQGDPAAPPPDPPAPTPPAPEETREYWQNRVAPINNQIDTIDREIDRLEDLGSADARAQISRLQTTRGQLEDQLDAIRLEARRLGVPSGWLR